MCAQDENCEGLYYHDQDEKLEGLYYRTKHQAETGGMYLEDTMRCIFGWKGEGEITIGEFKHFMWISGQCGDFFCENHTPLYSIDENSGVYNTVPNVSAIDGVDVVIRPKWSREDKDSYGQILDKIDENRLREELELNEKQMAKDTKKSKKYLEDNDDEQKTWPMAKIRSIPTEILFRSSDEKKQVAVVENQVHIAVVEKQGYAVKSLLMTGKLE